MTNTGQVFKDPILRMLETKVCTWASFLAMRSIGGSDGKTTIELSLCTRSLSLKLRSILIWLSGPELLSILETLILSDLTRRIHWLGRFGLLMPGEMILWLFLAGITNLDSGEIQQFQSLQSMTSILFKNQVSWDMSLMKISTTASDRQVFSGCQELKFRTLW